MIKIRKNWSRLPFEERLAKGKCAIEQCTANAAVPVMNPAFDNLKAAHQEFDDAHQEVLDLENRLAVARSRRQAAADRWDQFNSAYASYVEGCAANHASVALGAGYELAEPAGPRPAKEMSQVLRLVLRTGEREGEIDATWSPVPAARVYEVQTSSSPSDPALWQPYDVPRSRASLALMDLPSGKRIWVRVRALGRGNLLPGPWSDPAFMVAL